MCQPVAEPESSTQGYECVCREDKQAVRDIHKRTQTQMCTVGKLCTEGSPEDKSYKGEGVAEEYVRGKCYKLSESLADENNMSERTGHIYAHQWLGP
mmetsp:Transcript_3370/g.7643  ORF Transcript_3370/g.7643 Transcript_3370/m.7643 type:complete len:97 (+) Transcript_3370:130-420(+)